MGEEESRDAVGLRGVVGSGCIGAESQEDVGDGTGMVNEGGDGRGGKERWKRVSTCPVWSRYRRCRFARMSVACWRRRCSCVRAMVVR